MENRTDADVAEREPATALAEAPARAAPAPREKLQLDGLRIANHGVSFSNGKEMMDFAQMMAKGSVAVPLTFRNNPGACLALVSDSVVFGVNPFQLARETYVVNDQLSYQAKAIAALIIGRGPLARRPEYKFTGEGPDRVCTVTMALTNGTTIQHASPKFKDILPKNSPLWKSDPDQQLSYYTIRAAARRHMPDVILGIYDPEEAATFRREQDEAPRQSIVETLPGRGRVDVDAIDAAVGGTLTGARADRMIVDEVTGETTAVIASASDIEVIDEKSNGLTRGGAVITAADVVESDAFAKVADPLREQGIDEGQITMLRQIMEALAATETKQQIEVVMSEFAGAIENASEPVRNAAGVLFAHFSDHRGKAPEKLSEEKPKKAGKAKL